MLKHFGIKRHVDVDDASLLIGVQGFVDESSGQLGYRNVTEKLRFVESLSKYQDIINWSYFKILRHTVGRINKVY